MKFSESLKYNAVPEWKQYYLDYSGLKKLIYRLQKEQFGKTDNDEDITNSISNSDIETIMGGGSHNEIGATNTQSKNSNKNKDDEDDDGKNDFSSFHEETFEYHEEDFANFDITEEQLKNLSVLLQELLLSEENDQEHDESNNKESSSSSSLSSPSHTHKKKSSNSINDLESGFEETIELNDLSQKSDKNNIFGFNSGSSSSSSSNNLKNKLKHAKVMKKLMIGSKKLKDVTSNDQDSVSSKQNINSEMIFMKRILFQLQKIDNFYKKTDLQFQENFKTLCSDIEKSTQTYIPNHSTSQSRRPSQHTNSNAAGKIMQTTTAAAATAAGGKYNNISTTVSHLTQDAENPFHLDAEDDEDDEDDLEDGLYGSNMLSDEEHTALLDHTDFTIDSQKKAILKKATINLYVDMTQLKSFAELNKIGFSKICKKFDKTLNCCTKKKFIENNRLFQNTVIYDPEVMNEVDSKINELIRFFGLINDYTFEESKNEMRSYLRDYIVWERSTVWKDMLGLQSSKFNNSKNDKFIKQDDLAQLETSSSSPYHLPLRKFQLGKTKYNIYLPQFLFTWRALKLAIIIIFTIVLLCVPTFHDPVEHRCMALLECVALLWATEAIPLFVTALLIPFLEVLLLVFKDSETGKALSSAKAASTAFAAMWSSTVMVLLGGFTLAAALSKYNIAKVLASYLLSLAGKKPRNVLLMVMGVVFFLSMWISNVASPVLTYSLCQPLLRNLNADAPFAKALVLGVALSADIGGMASPISSPQNVYSQTYLKDYGLGWGQFFAVALPTGILAMFLVWGELCLTMNINKHKIQRFKPIKEKFTIIQWFVIFVTLVTILFWCFLSDMDFFGNAGVIAVIPMVLFFGSGLLNGEDLNNFPWSIVILAMGGVALGEGITSSGLLNTIGTALQKRIEDYSLFAVLCIFGIMMAVFGTFVSHTVAAIIMVPLVQEVGQKLPDPKAAPVLVFGCTLLASAGMGLASSGFPNITAYGKTDARGKRYLSVNSFIARGVPASLMVYLCVITLGYGIMKSVL